MSKKILIFNGSPRKAGNTAKMIEAFIMGTESENPKIEIIRPSEINIKPCRGCLRCNLFERCVLKGDDWPALEQQIRDADVLVFASPYLFSSPAGAAQTDTGSIPLVYSRSDHRNGTHPTPPGRFGQRRFYLFTCLGSSSTDDAEPVNALFKDIIEMMGGQSSLKTLTAARLAAAGQIGMSAGELSELYPKLKLPAQLAGADAAKNQALLKKLERLGAEAAE